MTMVPVERQAEILKAIGLDPRVPLTQALVAVANRYGLDPLLKHVYIIRDSIYVSHAALLHIAHKSGDFDGMEVKCEEQPDRWVATARIYRRSIGHPFEYQDECYKNEQKVPDKRKRAITRAERNALRRAFDIEVDVEPERIERTPTLSDEAPAIEIMPGGPKEASPSSGDEPQSPGTYDYRPLVILCREAGVTDDVRHAIVAELSDGRTESVKDLRPDEVQDFKGFVTALKNGVTPLCSETLEEVLKTWRSELASPTNSSA